MMTKWRACNLLRVPALLALLAACWLPSGATTLRRMDFGEIVRRADRVVHARAAEVTVRRDPSGTQIWTDIAFDVLEEAKGKGPARLTVTFLGGRDGKIEMHVEGTPDFRPGEEVVLFTSARPDGRKNIVGFSQGVMRVSQDPETGVKHVTTEVPAGVHFMEQGASGIAPTRPVRQRTSLSALMDHIRRLEAGEAPAGPSISRRPEKVQFKPLPATGEDRP